MPAGTFRDLKATQRYGSVKRWRCGRREGQQVLGSAPGCLTQWRGLTIRCKGTALVMMVPFIFPVCKWWLLHQALARALCSLCPVSGAGQADCWLSEMLNPLRCL